MEPWRLEMEPWRVSLPLHHFDGNRIRIRIKVKGRIWIGIRIKVKGRIQVRVKEMRILNTGFTTPPYTPPPPIWIVYVFFIAESNILVNGTRSRSLLNKEGVINIDIKSMICGKTVWNSNSYWNSIATKNFS